MPIGIQRLNAKKPQPNPRIVFIRPLKGPDERIAQDFLERIAAQCLPIMKEHHLSVVTLEEYEPNPEFVGRNFNAGEVIQLVLKSRSAGHWLPFNYVQMVMMHELAHCKYMNHSKAFWAVRNQYAEQMRTLWGRGYSGEGLWGRGALLATGAFEANAVTADEVLPEHLCGGTYRSRRKRRSKEQLSRQERKERRIRRKFGPGGVALGEDEDAKARLEKGLKTKTQAKPRVASSNRGRELRAAAALARFDQKKKEEEDEEARRLPEVIDLEDEEGEKAASGADSDDETASEAEQEEAAVDINGQRLLDNKGHSLVKICEDEDPEDGDAQNELKELLQSSLTGMKPPRNRDNQEAPALNSTTPARKTTTPQTKDQSDNNLADEKALDPRPKPSITIRKLPTKAEPKADVADPKDDRPRTTTSSVPNSTPAPAFSSGVCPMCSFDNGPDAAICSICSHVMDAGRVPGTWSCRGASCAESLFLNAGDAGVCGVCGARKTMSNEMTNLPFVRF